MIKQILKVILSVATLTTLNVWAVGPGEMGGGSGVAYYAPNKPKTVENLLKVESTDVYRTKNEFRNQFNIEIDPEFLENKTNMSSEEIEAQSDVLLQLMINKLKPNSPSFVLKLLNANKLIQDWVSLPASESLKLINDFGPSLNLPDSDKMSHVQIIKRYVSHLFKDNNYYQKMDAFNRASIKFHELAYAASGHASSYYIQMLFAHIVGGKLNNIEPKEFDELMQKIFLLGYQHSTKGSEGIFLLEGVRLVKDSFENTTDSFRKWLKVYNDTYGDGGRISDYAPSDALCGEITEVDYDHHTISFQYRKKNINPFEDSEFSDWENKKYKLSAEKWQQIKEIFKQSEAFLQSTYPKYMYPATFISNQSNICIKTNLIGNFIQFYYLEVQFGQSRSESINLMKDAAESVEILTTRLADKKRITFLEQKINELVKMRDETPTDTKADIIKSRKLTSQLAQLIAEEASIKFKLNEQEAASSLRSMKTMDDFETIRTLGFQFKN